MLSIVKADSPEKEVGFFMRRENKSPHFPSSEKTGRIRADEMMMSF
jgi:hypothetical protein